MHFPKNFDVIVVGGGHAGTEAALASARMGAATLLLTHNIETLGQMSCNPSIGGIGKGHLVKEVDALGGAMAMATDEAGIQFRILNGSQGSGGARDAGAGRSRALQGGDPPAAGEPAEPVACSSRRCDDLMVEGDRVVGAVTQVGIRFRARAVVLTAGTFLDGRIHVGLDNYQAGRAGDPPARQPVGAAEGTEAAAGSAEDRHAAAARRPHHRLLEAASSSPGDGMPGRTPTRCRCSASWATRDMHPRQVPCWITHTNARTHEIIRSGFDRSPMFTGEIDGVGPRYCPSIEDKVNRFADKDSAPDLPGARRPDDARVLPERHLDRPAVRRPVSSWCARWPAWRTRTSCGRATPSNTTTSIPRALQAAASRRGRSAACSSPARSTARPATKRRRRKACSPASMPRCSAAATRAWLPRRDQAYLGVLVDDLITKGVTEPYRMFTSRAEFRLQLREDNADMRLTEAGRQLGLVDDARWDAFSRKRDAVSRETERLRATWVPVLPASRRRRPCRSSATTACSTCCAGPGVDFDAVVAIAPSPTRTPCFT